MATTNPFDLLGDNDYEDPSQLVVAQPQKPSEKTKKAPVQAQPPSKPAAKFPTKPAPPAQAVRETRNEAGRGGGRGGGLGYGRGGGRGYDRDSSNVYTLGGSIGLSGAEGEAGKSSERRGYGTPRGSFRGGRRGDFSNGESRDGERPRRAFERHSGTGRGNEFKRDGAGRGNWGTPTDEISVETEEPAAENENTTSAKKPSGDEAAADANKENPVNEPEEKEPEDKEMTLEEYEKLLEEKRKVLLALKTEERKVDVDKEFQSMQPLSNKKNNDEIFIKLDKRKDATDKEEKTKKSVSINEFLKPAEGERYYNPGGRGRGRGRGRGSRSGSGGNMSSNVAAPSIEDHGQFPTLGGK